MNNKLSRRDLEKRIVQTGEAIDLMKQDGSWLDDDEFRKFLDAWWDLNRFYEEHTDTVISIETIREYVDFVRLLRGMMVDDEIAKEFQQKAKDELEAIEYYMDEIIREGVSNLENSDSS
jgi:hypothetical protein